jgi:hypothetical protein
MHIGTPRQGQSGRGYFVPYEVALSRERRVMRCAHADAGAMLQPCLDIAGCALRALRDAVRTIEQQFPFHADALVVLLGHLLVVLTLPHEDGDISSRLRLVKNELVTRVADWPGSTFQREVRLGVYPPD